MTSREEQRREWISLILRSNSEPHRREAVRAEIDMSLVEEVGSLIQSTRENLVAVLAEVGSEIVRARESSERTARALNWFTGILAFATVVLAGATVALVLAPLKLAKA